MTKIPPPTIPFSVLDTYKWLTFFANKINNQLIYKIKKMFKIIKKKKTFNLFGWFLTVVGMDKRSSGNFRPNLFVMNPNMMLPTNPPMHVSDATHDAWSIEILPDDNGVRFDVSNSIFGLGHPHVMPQPIISIFTNFVSKWQIFLNLTKYWF